MTKIVSDNFLLKSKWKWVSIISAVVVFLMIISFADFGAGKESAELTAAVAILMSILWITEAIPLAATSLIPLVLFPLLGVVSGSDTASAYINSTIFLFLGGFLIAVAMEKWELHKRISLTLISHFGKTPSQIVLGFMVASAFISMWISNTATAVMLLPIGLAVISEIESEFGKERSAKFSIALMLGIAYACSIGGIGTIIGTPPNLVFQRIFKISFPDLPLISFGNWMVFALPLSAVMLFIAWLILTKVVSPPGSELHVNPEIINEEKRKLGKMSFEEKTVAYVFLATAVLWIFRKDINLDIFVIPGWSNIIPSSKLIDDGTVAIAMSLLLFILPVKHPKDKSNAVLSVKDIRKVPWEIILLFGGGFALAKGFVTTGLSGFLASHLHYLKGVPIILLIAIICLSITFLTELTSNTATAQIILPILAAMSVELEIQPMLLMVPATISASMAFMMPVATPPNAIVFGSGRLKVWDMARAGLVLNFIGAALITVYVYFFL